MRCEGGCDQVRVTEVEFSTAAVRSVTGAPVRTVTSLIPIPMRPLTSH